MKFNTIIFSIIFTLVSLVVHAQHYTVGIGPEFNFPSGNSANLSSVGLGGGIKAEYGISKKFGVTANGSFVSFLGRNYFGIATEAIKFIPVKAGFKYYPDDNFYFEGQLGAAFPVNSNRPTALSWSPGLGTYIRLGKADGKLDVGLRYEGLTNSRRSDILSTNYNTFSFIGVSVAYALNLK